MAATPPNHDLTGLGGGGSNQHFHESYSPYQTSGYPPHTSTHHFTQSEALTNSVNGTETTGSSQSHQYGAFDQSHSIQHLAQQISQGMNSHVQSAPVQSQFESLASQQMQQIQQMRMLQSLGQYSQLGLSGFQTSGFAQNYQDHHSQQGQQLMADHDFNEPKHDTHMKQVKVDDKMKLTKDSKKGKRKKTSNVKRPTTAYLYFVSKYRQKIKEAGEPMPKAKEMMQECAAKWRNMSIEEKSPYQKLADIDKERWQTEKAAEKKPKDQYRPKRPPSAYFLFLRDFRESWKIEHEEEIKAEEAAKLARLQGLEKPKEEKEEEEEVKEKEKSQENDDTESQLTIDESSQSSNNNKPDVEQTPMLTPPEVTPPPPPLLTPSGKKEKPPRKMSRVVEITKKAGEKWNSMTDEDKAPYVAKAQETRLKWEKELQIYKHEIKNGKTGEEASNRLTELHEDGADAIDDFCSEINQQASAEKKIKLENKITPSNQVLAPPKPIAESEQSDDKQESVSPAPASTPPAQIPTQVFSPQQQSPSTPAQHTGTPEQTPHQPLMPTQQIEQAAQQQAAQQQAAAQQHHMEQHAAAQQHQLEQQQQQAAQHQMEQAAQQREHHQQQMQHHLNQPYAHHYTPGHMQHQPHDQQAPSSGQYVHSYEGWNHQMFHQQQQPPPGSGGHQMN